MKNNHNILNGYIEGYYGRLLNWEERNRIIEKLSKNKMNFYFYAPKEDDKHRLYWKKKYSESWKYNFLNFCNNAKKNKIKIITGISPGLNFNFKEFLEKKADNKNSNDLNILVKKIFDFIKIGTEEIAILFDDLPDNFIDLYGNKVFEGIAHAELVNTLSLILKKNIYVVPRIYANQLILESQNYLIDYGKIINKNNINFFFWRAYCLKDN